MRERNRVLVVEDEALVALNIQMMLEHLGYEVRTGSSADEAFDVAGAFHPDVVLMDVRLGDEDDGIATAKRLRGAYDLPVVFVTAYGDDDTLRRALETHPYGFLQKPIHERQLQATVQVALTHHEASRAEQATEEDLPMPVLPLDGGVLVAPVVGRIADGRLQRLTQGLRDALGRHKGKALILDVTGATGVDAKVGHLLEAVAGAAFRAPVILCGVSDEQATGDASGQQCPIPVCEDLKGAVALARRLASEGS